MSEPALSLRERLRALLVDISEKPYFKRRMADDCTVREYIDGQIVTELSLIAAFPKCTVEWAVDADGADLSHSVLAVAVTENGKTVGGVIKGGAVTMYEAPSGCFASWQG